MTECAKDGEVRRSRGRSGGGSNAKKRRRSREGGGESSKIIEMDVGGKRRRVVERRRAKAKSGAVAPIRYDPECSPVKETSIVLA